MLMLPLHVRLPLLVVLMLLLMLAVAHVPVGRHEDMTREVVLQQVSRDWHAVTLSIGRGHGGAVGVSHTGTPGGVHPIGACPSVMPLLRSTALVRRRESCIHSPLLCQLGLSTRVCNAIWQGGRSSSLICRGHTSRGLRHRASSPVSVAESSSVQVIVQLLDVPRQDVIRHWGGCGCGCTRELWWQLAWRRLLVLPLLMEGGLRRLRAHVRKQLLQCSLLLAHPPAPHVCVTSCRQEQVQL